MQIALAACVVIGLCTSISLGQLASNAPAPGSITSIPKADSFFGNLLKVYMPRRMCMFEETRLIWLHVVSDSLIALAYYSIPIALIYFVRRRRDLAFHWMFLCFAAFIMSCGATHVLAVLAIWHPVYRLDGIVKLLTAIASVGTAVLLWLLIPKAIALPSPAELRAANKELESFGYSVSHDLRAPLRSLDGFSQLLLESYSQNLDAEGQDHLHRIRAASQKMGHLIDDLLALSQLSRLEMKKRKVDLSKLASEIARKIGAAAPQSKVELIVEEGLFASADPTLLRVVLSNLLENAWKFSAKRFNAARIEFGRTMEGGKPAFFIRDNGVGFDMAYAGKLFSAFERLHPMAEFSGSGIGLATVQRIIQRHGGRVWAEGIVGAGATFHFTL